MTLTNGTAEVTRGFLERAGLDDLVDRVVDVTTAGRWKPAPEPYREVWPPPACPPDAAAMVAAHPWDIGGAMAAGLAGGLRRPARRVLAAVPPTPDRAGARRRRRGRGPAGGGELMVVARSLALFVLAAIAEIGGAWLVWQGLRDGRGWVPSSLGAMALGGYGVVATLQPETEFGGIFAAYGGVFIVGSILWGMAFEGFRPDGWDLAGGALCLAGMALIMFAPAGRLTPPAARSGHPGQSARGEGVCSRVQVGDLQDPLELAAARGVVGGTEPVVVGHVADRDAVVGHVQDGDGIVPPDQARAGRWPGRPRAAAPVRSVRRSAHRPSARPACCTGCGAR